MAETEKIQFKVEATGAQEAAREFERVATSLGKTGQQANDNAKRFADFKKELDSAKAASAQFSAQASAQGDAFIKLSQTASRGANVMNAFSGALSSAVPEIAQVGSVLGRTSSAISAMTGILGGAAGVATGGVLLAVGLFAKGLYDVTQETKNLAKATIDYNTTLEDQLRLLKSADEKQRLRQQLALGVASPDVTLAQARSLEARQTQVRFDLANFPRREDGSIDPANAARFERLNKVRVALDAEIKKTHADYARLVEENRVFAEEDARNEMEEGKKKGVRKPTREGLMEGERQYMALERFNLEHKKRMQALDDAEKLGAQIESEAFARKKAGFEQEQSLRRESFNATLKGAREADRELAKIDKEREGRNKLFRDSGVEAMKMVGESGIQALNAIAKGEKVSGRQIIAGIGDQLVSKGTYYLFEGLARAIASFGADPSAAGLIGLGTAEIAAGMAMGAAASGGASGSGGGGNRPQNTYYVQNSDGTYTQTVSAIEPASRPSTSMGGEARVVNIYQPTVVSPNAQDGVRLRQAANEMRRQGL